MNITFIIILVATIAISYHGFNNPTFFNRYKFNVGAVQKAIMCACYLLVSSTPIGNISFLIWFHSISFRM